MNRSNSSGRRITPPEMTFQQPFSGEAPRRDRKRRNRRRAVFFSALGLAALLAVAFAAFYVYHDLLSGLRTDPGTDPAGQAVSAPEEAPDPDFPSVYDITDATDLHTFLRQWWYNGGEEQIRYSKDVLNVLLLGIDNNEGQVGAGRSDTMMLVSINKKLRSITLLSLLRDSYCYMNVNGTESYHRINSAYHYGGPAGMMQAITNLYKIRVDKYVSVDFASFSNLIDALGGVRVDVTEQEASYINRTAPSMKRSFPSGEDVLLNGRQALVFSRIRKLDSDQNRTDRQQRVIESIIRSAKDASLGQLYHALDQTLPYVKTNFSRAEILRYVPSATAWVNYGMTKLHSPVLEGEERSAIGSTIRGMAVWVVDYPLAARQVQLVLYGESNIDVEADGDRDAYIDGLFQGAADRGSKTQSESYTTGAAAESAQPEESAANWSSQFSQEESAAPPGQEESTDAQTAQRDGWFTFF
ncbi:MAG: LCP family protein [Oscillospiraceae bacterium]|jgi:LCP family protein required for cell wall assembly|nr:LCP family protein [Oscillospiraceae bacterium]